MVNGRGLVRWKAGDLARAAAVRAVGFSVAWWAIVEGRPVGWYWAVAGVLLATASSLALWPAGRWSLVGVLRFIPYFLVESTRGGFDVALRAFRPGRQVRPGFIEHRFEDPDAHVRLLFTNLVCLTPGTLAARLEQDAVIIHLLDDQSPAVDLPRHLETRLSATTSGPRPP